MNKIYKNAKIKLWDNIKSIKYMQTQDGFDKYILEKMICEKYDLLAYIDGKLDKAKYNY